MVIPLSSAGGLFVRIGHELAGMLDANALRGGPATPRVLSGANLLTRLLNTVEPDYAAGTPLPQVLDGSIGVLASAQGALNSILTDGSNRILNTLLAMYAIDQLGIPSTAPLSALTSGVDKTKALQTLISQMQTSSDSVQAATVSAGAQTAAGPIVGGTPTPAGNPVIVMSLKNPQGIALQFPFPETLTFICTNDSQNSAPLGNEPFSVFGQPPADGPLSQRYPQGSGIGVNLSCVDGSKDRLTGNLLTNSDFRVFTTANYPDNWVSLGGAPGTNVFQSTGGVYLTGGGAIQFTGTGGTPASIAQPFNTPASTGAGVGGTPTVLKPDTVYHVNFWVKVSATPTAGALRVSLIDGSNAIINDDAGTANSFIKVLTAVSTSWVNVHADFRTPAILPSVQKLRLDLSTDIDSGKSAFAADLSFVNPSALYDGGPYCSMHSGNARSIAGLMPDAWTVAISNNYSTTAHGLLHQWMDRIFGLRALKLQLPIASSPSIGDGTIA